MTNQLEMLDNKCIKNIYKNSNILKVVAIVFLM